MNNHIDDIQGLEFRRAAAAVVAAACSDCRRQTAFKRDVKSSSEAEIVSVLFEGGRSLTKEVVAVKRKSIARLLLLL